jgi:hypothetical protein
MIGRLSPASLKISSHRLQREVHLTKISFKFQVFKKRTDINGNEPKLIIFAKGSNRWQQQK